MYQSSKQKVPKGIIRRYQRGNQKVLKGIQKVPKGNQKVQKGKQKVPMVVTRRCLGGIQKETMG